MNRLMRALIWLRRIGYCRGFGIQSPTDYRFVRYVVNEHWPYHAYDTFPRSQDWLTDKLGKLYLRLANDRQPGEIIDGVGARDYLQAGCRKAQIVEDGLGTVQLAVVPLDADRHALFERCNDQSVVIFDRIFQDMSLWHQIIKDRRVQVSFDLYYCGIVCFNKSQSRHHYKVNF